MRAYRAHVRSGGGADDIQGTCLISRTGLFLVCAHPLDFGVRLGDKGPRVVLVDRFALCFANLQTPWEGDKPGRIDTVVGKERAG